MVAACGGPARHSTSAGAAPAQSAAKAALHRAAAAMSALRSYSFTITASGEQTRLTGQGRVSQPDRLLATFVTSGATVSVFSAGGHGYVLRPGGRWQRDTALLVHPVRWSSLLAGVNAPKLVTVNGGARTVTANLNPAGLAAVGMSASSSAPARLTLHLDGQYRVVSLVVDLASKSAMTETLTVFGFDTTPAVPATPPAAVGA